MATVFPHYLSTFQRPIYPGAVAEDFALDDATYILAWVFRAPQAITITRVGFYLASTNGTPPTYRYRLEGVDAATGFPDGSDLGGGSPTAGTSSSWSTGSNWKNLGNSYVCTRGQLMALVLEYSSGGIDGSNNITVSYRTDSPIRSGFPYTVKDSGAGYALNDGGYPIFGFGSAGRRYGNMVPATATASPASVDGNRIACKFALNSNLGSTFTVLGFRTGATIAATGGTFKGGLWNAAGTMLQEVTYDTDVWNGSHTQAHQLLDVIFDEVSLTSLSYGTDYYIGLERASGIDVGLSVYNLNAADDRETMYLPGAFAISSWNGSSWSDTNTLVPIVELLIEEHTGSQTVVALSNPTTIHRPAYRPVGY